MLTIFAANFFAVIGRKTSRAEATRVLQRIDRK
jgi:hypothetical protein